MQRDDDAQRGRGPEDQPTAPVLPQRPQAPKRPGASQRARAPQRPGPSQRPGAAQRPARPQRPPSQRPAPKRFGVEQARSPEFALVFRGYEREAVDRYVAQVVDLINELEATTTQLGATVSELETTIAELEATQTREGTVQRALEEVGEQTSSILQRAHETAEEIVGSAHAEAERHRAGAEREAQQTIAEAAAWADRVRNDARHIWERRSRLLEELRRLSDEVLTVADDALERLEPPDADLAQATATDSGPVPSGAGGEAAPEDASGAVPEPTGEEPAVRETSPSPSEPVQKPRRRTVGPIGDPLDIPPEDALGDEGPAVRRVGPERRQR